MLLKIFSAIVAVVALFLGYVAFQPAVGTISRSLTIPAPPEQVFPHVNELKKWEAWSPWAKLDPYAKATFEGPDTGVGSAMSWAGNSEVGEGKMTIVESDPAKRVKYRIDFIKPFTNTSDADFQFEPEGSGTKVTWTMTGERPFFARAMCILFQADKMVGETFEKGLASLSAVSSAKPG